MNDTELDQLLNTWEAPSPSAALRTDLRDRFPRAERRWSGRPLRWALVIAVASATLAVGTEQAGGGNPVGWVYEKLHGWYEAFRFGMEAYDEAAVRNMVRNSNPLVYVDGQLAGPITYKGGATMWVDIPGAGAYGVSTVHEEHWAEAGRVHDNVLEFQAGGHQVRIQCDQPVVQSSHPLYLIRQP